MRAVGGVERQQVEALGELLPDGGERLVEEVDRIRDVLTELGAVQAVEQRIAALTGSALDALAAAPVAAPAATQLAELAITATRRRR